MSRLSIIGAGSFGSALASSFAKAKHSVVLYSHSRETFENIVKNRNNPNLFNGYTLPEEVSITNTLEDCLSVDYALLVTPAQNFHSAILDIKNTAKDSSNIPTIIICSKGFEQKSGKLLSEILELEIPQSKYAILTGPAFSNEIGRGLPTALTCAMKDINSAIEISKEISTQSIRLYANDDVIGAQVGGAVKNVLAIATGIATGMGLGHNAVAGIITRGLSEMRRFSIALGGKDDTTIGLSGLGDLVLTATSSQSRNFSHGVNMALGKASSDKALVEGIWTAEAVHSRAMSLNVDMPICSMVYNILYNNVSMDYALKTLMQRALKTES